MIFSTVPGSSPQSRVKPKLFSSSLLGEGYEKMSDDFCVRFSKHKAQK